MVTIAVTTVPGGGCSTGAGGGCAALPLMTRKLQPTDRGRVRYLTTWRLTRSASSTYSRRSSAPLPANPLCVFENAVDLSSEQMQALARQFNLSETTFILPSTRADARVRISPPRTKWPLQATQRSAARMSAAVCNWAAIPCCLEMQAGLIQVHASGDRWTLSAPPATSVSSMCRAKRSPKRSESQ